MTKLIKFNQFTNENLKSKRDTSYIHIRKSILSELSYMKTLNKIQNNTEFFIPLKISDKYFGGDKEIYYVLNDDKDLLGYMKIGTIYNLFEIYNNNKKKTNDYIVAQNNQKKKDPTLKFKKPEVDLPAPLESHVNKNRIDVVRNKFESILKIFSKLNNAEVFMKDYVLIMNTTYQTDIKVVHRRFLDKLNQNI